MTTLLAQGGLGAESTTAGLETPDGGLRTEFAFTLPLGYVDPSGERHREGIMRLATARDEILPLRDPRVRDNEAYLTVMLLSRVVTRLGSVTSISPGTIESLFAPDLAFLQEMYRRLNQEGRTVATVTCPSCSSDFGVDIAGAARHGDPAGGS